MLTRQSTLSGKASYWRRSRRPILKFMPTAYIGACQDCPIHGTSCCMLGSCRGRGASVDFLSASLVYARVDRLYSLIPIHLSWLMIFFFFPSFFGWCRRWGVWFSALPATLLVNNMRCCELYTFFFFFLICKMRRESSKNEKHDSGRFCRIQRIKSTNDA